MTERIEPIEIEDDNGQDDHRYHNKDICQQTGKRIFYSKSQAKQQKKRVKRKYHDRRTVYDCPYCKHYHLTTSSGVANGRTDNEKLANRLTCYWNWIRGGRLRPHIILDKMSIYRVRHHYRWCYIGFNPNSPEPVWVIGYDLEPGDIKYGDQSTDEDN